jgi:hypothetical protein
MAVLQPYHCHEIGCVILSDVVVTGVSNPRSKLSSSVSVSTLRNDDIAKAAPRTTAEIFRSIPVSNQKLPVVMVIPISL